jgi:molybdopterin synthase catalytic subunit
VIDVTTAPIDPSAVLDRVGGREDGAVLLFLGTVRDHNDGRLVEGLQYEAYPETSLWRSPARVPIARSRSTRDGT